MPPVQGCLTLGQSADYLTWSLVDPGSARLLPLFDLISVKASVPLLDRIRDALGHQPLFPVGNLGLESLGFLSSQLS